MNPEVKKVRKKREPHLIVALIPIVVLIAVLMFAVLKLETDAHIPLIIAAAVGALIAIYGLGYTWKEMENGAIRTIGMGMQAILILGVVGALIGSWILSGVVPAMIYYGLMIISPGVFLLVSCVICSIVSLATGSSWTTAGTVGIALIGIGGSMGIPLPIVAGSIVSGAYFGDKMSPLSDTTNLAPAMAGSKLFEHIRHMVYTTGPSLLIALVIFGAMSIPYGKGVLDTEQIQSIMSALTESFTINLWLLIPPILVIVMVVLRTPAIPGLLAGVLLGTIFAVIFQSSTAGDIFNVLNYGFTSETGNAVIDDLLTRGGIQGMMWTISLILCALSFGGIMEASGILAKLAGSILKLARGRGSLVLATLLSCIGVNILASDQYLAIVIPGRMYRTSYLERGLAPVNLSRALEDSGTLTSPLVPWNTCGATMSTFLGVATVAYLPFCFLNLVNPVISAIYGFTGLTMKAMSPEERVAWEKEKIEIEKAKREEAEA